MKLLLIVPLMMMSGWALAEEPNPFMSAEDRQQHIEQEKKQEEAKLQKLVADAVKEIKSEMAEQQAQQANALSTEGVEGGSRRTSAAPSPSSAAAFPSDFAIAGIKGNHILMRQMDNKSIIVTSGEIFWDKGQAYEAEIVGNESVSILRVSDGEVVFYGGVGSVFTPSAGGSDDQAAPAYRDNGGA